MNEDMKQLMRIVVALEKFKLKIYTLLNREKWLDEFIMKNSPCDYDLHRLINKIREDDKNKDKCSICGAPLKGFIYYEKNGFKICRFCYKDLQMKEG